MVGPCTANATGYSTKKDSISLPIYIRGIPEKRWAKAAIVADTLEKDLKEFNITG